MTPIEKAARAVCADECDVARHGPDRCDCKWWTAHVPAVRAALTAIREPSEAMVEAMRVASGHQISRTDLRLAYVAAIDAALKEGP